MRAILFGLAVVSLGVSGVCTLWLVVRTWRRHRQRVPDVTPQWLNENVYDRDGDERWK